jgi:hypothetical protein
MRINGWQRLGILISVAWLLATSWAYFDELWNNPSAMTTYLPDSSYELYEWVSDLDFTQKAHEDHKLQGKDFAYGFIFLKPTFSISGFLTFSLSPILASWLVVYLVIYTSRWVKRGFQTYS